MDWVSPLLHVHFKVTIITPIQIPSLGGAYHVEELQQIIKILPFTSKDHQKLPQTSQKSSN